MDTQFLLGELFCGPGGLAYGAGLASEQGICNTLGEKFTIEHQWGVDQDPMAIKTYRRSVASVYGGEGICVDAWDFVNNLSEKHKKINSLAFGFPCNDFSIVGKHKGIEGKFGNLYKAGIKVIEQCNPIWFVAENVSGLRSANSGDALKNILNELENAGEGYNITPNLYKFEEYGVPQYRHRFIIVGIRKDHNLKFEVPCPTTCNNPIAVKNALSNIALTATNNEVKRTTQKVIDRLRFTPPWKNAWFLDELEQKNPEERQQILEKLPWYNEIKDLSDNEVLKIIDQCKLRCTKARMSHIYKRLDKDRPAYTITGSGGGGTHVYHWKEHRALTNRERARIQTFPDSFIFEGTTEQVRKQIGMAVPPLGAKIIVEALLKTFAKIPYATASLT